MTLGELIVTGRRLVAARTNRRRAFARAHAGLDALAIGTEGGLVVNESRKSCSIRWKMATAKTTKINRAATGPRYGLEHYCRDLNGWPRSWMGLEKDFPPGEQLLAFFRPFLESLAASDLSPKTIQKHVDNMWALSGEFIRDPHHDPSPRKKPVDASPGGLNTVGRFLTMAAKTSRRTRVRTSRFRSTLTRLEPTNSRLQRSGMTQRADVIAKHKRTAAPERMLANVSAHPLQYLEVAGKKSK